MVFESITCPPDHPRVCGANADERDVSDLVAGSSPRVRGELDGHVLDADDGRIIPACAGRTPLLVRWIVDFTDHPRVCGANDSPLRPSHSPRGSSPRVRGERRTVAAYVLVRRIIPACAGRTPATRGHRTRGPDHPRVCGANRMCCSLSMRRAGSSPRVRGELPVGPLGLGWDRIIPACAGRTPSRRSNEPDRPDHPRVCGANGGVGLAGLGGLGSSPRVRGEREGEQQPRPLARIIPACAGRTVCAGFIVGPFPDHPRVCGANPSSSMANVSPSGSSPRVRGERPRNRVQEPARRIIPACAGRTAACRESADS